MEEVPTGNAANGIKGLTLHSKRLGGISASVASFRGLPFLFPAGSQIGELAARGCEWDAVLRDIVSTLLPQIDPIICDVGSNIGASFRQMLDAKPGARFLVFEPSERFRPFLEANIRLANAINVEVFSSAVSSEAGNITLYNGLTTGSVLVSKGAVEEQLVEMITLDGLFEERGHPVHFIKIDTDGHDLQVLLGAAAVLDRHRPVVYFEHHPRIPDMPHVTTDSLGDLEWLQLRGYREFICLSPDGSLLGVTHDAREASEWCGLHGYGDILVCPDGSPAREHLKTLLDRLKAADPVLRNAGRELELEREVLSLQRRVAEGEKQWARSCSKLEKLLKSAENKQDRFAAEVTRLREKRWWRHPSRALARLFQR